MNVRTDRSGLGLVSMLLALAIVAVLYYVVTKTYFKPGVPRGMTQDVKQTLSTQEVNTSSYSGMIDSAKNAAEQASQANAQAEKLMQESADLGQ